MTRPDEAAIASVFREEYGRVVATLVGAYRDIDLAEDAVQEARRPCTETVASVAVASLTRS